MNLGAQFFFILFLFTDIDECALSFPCDIDRGECINTVGSSTCSCIDDYILGPNNVCNGG